MFCLNDSARCQSDLPETSKGETAGIHRPATTAARMDMDDVAGAKHDASLLGLEGAVGMTGRLQPVGMRAPVAAAEQPTGPVLDAFAGGIGERRLFRFQLQFEFTTNASAILPMLKCFSMRRLLLRGRNRRVETGWPGPSLPRWEPQRSRSQHCGCVRGRRPCW